MPSRLAMQELPPLWQSISAEEMFILRGFEASVTYEDSLATYAAALSLIGDFPRTYEVR